MAAYTKATPGAPSGGLYNVGDTITDSVNTVWKCVKGGVISSNAIEPSFIGMSVTKIGTANVTVANGLTYQEFGDGAVNRSVLTLAALVQTIRDTTSPAQGGGTKLFTFPEGRIYMIGATGSLTFTTTSILANTLNTGVTCQWGLGTVTQANTTLATTEQNLLPVTAWTAGTTINVANAATTAALASPAVFDGTATAIAAFLNTAVAGATDIDADATVAINGTITLTWAYLGDY